MWNILAGLCALIFCANIALAANTEQDLQRAVELLNADSPGQAYELLLERHEAGSVNPQEWFLLGIAAKQAGRLEEAAVYFERLLELDPEATRARLELAEIAYRLGEGDKARQLLLDVKAANPPAGVADHHRPFYRQYHGQRASAEELAGARLARLAARQQRQRRAGY